MQYTETITGRRQRLKMVSRGALQGHVFRSFAACMIPGLITWVLRLLPSDLFVVRFLVTDGYAIGFSVFMLAVSSIASTFVTGPLNVGVAGYFMRLLTHTEKPPSPLSVCDCFGPGYWRLMLGMFLQRAAAWVAAALPLPLLLLPDMITPLTIEGIDLFVLSSPAWVVVFIASVFYIYVNTALSMTPYLLFDQPSASARDTLRQSIQLTRGRVFELFVMQLSFFLWLWMVAISFLIGAFYVYPYIEGTMAAYYLTFTRSAATAEDALREA